LAALLVSASLGAACAEEAPPPSPPPPAVEVVQVVQRDVPIYLESIGVTRGDAEVDVRARVEGVLQSVDFVEGRIVKKGDLLSTIDPRELLRLIEKPAEARK
jgi:multidrug efflux pump subunit AcrA (membrane-fusion protein)